MMLLQGENLYPSPLIRESVESTSPSRFLPPVRSRERTMMMVDEYEEVFRDAQRQWMHAHGLECGVTTSRQGQRRRSVTEIDDHL